LISSVAINYWRFVWSCACREADLIDIELGRASRMLAVHLTSMLYGTILQRNGIARDGVGSDLPCVLYRTDSRAWHLLDTLPRLDSGDGGFSVILDGLSEVVLHHEEGGQLELRGSLPHLADYVLIA
jgi:hypothetical protein